MNKTGRLSPLSAALLVLGVLCLDIEGAQVAYSKPVSTNLTIELHVETLPARPSSERGFSAAKLSWYQELERQGRVPKPE